MSTQAVRGAGRAVRRPLGPAVIAMIVALAGSGLAPAVRAHAAPARLPYDAATLSEIAEDVVRRALTGRRPAPEGIAPDADPVQELDGVEGEPDPPLAHMAPARAGTTVRVAPGVATAGNVKAPRGTGYVSNTGQQRWESAQSQLLTFSSGALRPAPGLDPALQAHATTVDARGRQVVYGFLLLRIRPDESLERTLAGLGVALLGPHDDAHKARLPIWPSSPWICSWPFRPSRCSRYSWRAVPDPAKPTGWCEQRDGDPAAIPPPGREPREREAPTWPGSTSAS